MRLSYRPLVVAALLLGAAACGRRGAEPEAGQEPAPVVRRPLAPYASQPLIVVPVQRLRGSDETGFAAAAGAPRALLARLDDELAFAVRERGTASAWVFAPEVVRAARRNPTLATDPYALAVEPLLAAKPAVSLNGALAGQLRSLVALSGARWAVVPTELRFARRADGQGEAVLRVAVVDTRAARRVVMAEVRSDPAGWFSPGLLTSLAGRFADLITAPSEADGA